MVGFKLTAELDFKTGFDVFVRLALYLDRPEVDCES